MDKKTLIILGFIALGAIGLYFVLRYTGNANLGMLNPMLKAPLCGVGTS